MTTPLSVTFHPPASKQRPPLDLAALCGPESPWAFADDLWHHGASALRGAEEVVGAFNGCSDLLVIGIGGSALGARSLCRALGFTNVHFLENADADHTHRTLAALPLKRLGVHVVSKSGTTTETLLNTAALVRAMDRDGGRNWGKRLVVTGDPPAKELNPLQTLAQRVGGRFVPMNGRVGGRFCAFTTVGLAPVLFAGGNARRLRQGGLRALQDVAGGQWNGLLASLRAQAVKGRRTVVYMPYHDRLEDLGEWVVQLISESLGKQKGRDRLGLTPIGALGSRDQHSYLQLIQDGPRDKQVILLTVDKSGVAADRPVARPKGWPEFPALLTGHRLHDVQVAQADATAQALGQGGVPVQRWRLAAVNEATLGYHGALWMSLTAALGTWMGVDPFNQPGVEASKKATKAILSAPS